jgi:hypothetical protein
MRTNLKDVVASQLPEFVRSEYPTFVAFVEAYYEYLEQNSVDISKVRDIDETLDSFIQYFKGELAHNYPISSNIDTERYLLKHIKEQYLAKGSEASYKLLFRLLYGKDVYMEYPGKSMLRVSDGRWQQDVSIFVRVDVGDPMTLVGKTIDVQTSKKIYRTSVVQGTQKVSKVTANIESVLQFSENVYELFLDRNFYGDISPGDVVKFESSFQGQILPTTAKLKIQNRGYNFKPGQVFQVASGDGTPIWFKVLRTDTDGGLLNIDLIKFALGYSTDFSITVLPTSAVSTKKKIAKPDVSVSYSLTPDVIGSVAVLNGGTGYQQVPDVVVGGNGTGATAHAVVVDGVVTEVIVDNPGTGYTTGFVNINAQPGDTGIGAEGEVTLGIIYDYNYLDKTSGFTETGYINMGDYWVSGYSDGAYVGTIARQFFVDAKDTLTDNPALLNVSLGAFAKYPGYYKTNDGFLSDSMFIQDSYYYQAFSYVIRIDEQLQSYASVVRSMLHPSGMAMFGEYSINNNIELNVALTAIVKSLGVTLYDTVSVNDNYEVDENGVIKVGTAFSAIKALDDTLSTPFDIIQKFVIGKRAADESVVLAENYLNKLFGKRIGFTGQAETTFVIDDGSVKTLSKSVTQDFQPVTDLPAAKLTSKQTTDFQPVGDSAAWHLDLNKITEPVNETGTYAEDGYVTLEPYDQGGYFAEHYANERPSSWSI